MYLPLLPPAKVNNRPKIGETFLTIIATAIRLRRVTRRMVRETDILLASAKASESNGLPMHWAQFLEAMNMHASSYKAFKKRLNTIRRCRNPEVGPCLSFGTSQAEAMVFVTRPVQGAGAFRQKLYLPRIILLFKGLPTEALATAA